MRAKYLFFTLLTVFVSASQFVAQAGQVSLLDHSDPGFSMATARSSPTTLLDQSVKFFGLPSQKQYETGIRETPNLHKKKDIPLVWSSDAYDSEDDCPGMHNAEEPIYTDPDFKKLSERLDDALNKIESWLKDNLEIVLVLGLDIDGTILHRLDKENPFSDRRTFYNPAQQERLLTSLDRFTRNNKNVYLFLNTSRHKLSYEQPVVTEDTSTKFLTCCFPPPKMPREIFSEISGSDKEWITYKLPFSNALITGGGQHIEFENQRLSNDSAAIEINNALKDWFTSDTENLTGELARIKRHGHTASDDTMLPVIITPKAVGSQTIPEPFTTMLMMQFIILREKELIHNYAFNGIAINKGTSSRLMLSFLQKKDFLKGKKGLLVTAGDNVADLPMINPMLEAASLKELNDIQKQILEKRIERSITETSVPILDSDYLSKGNLTWLLGVLACDNRFQNACVSSNDAIKQALSNEKVVTIEGQELDLTVKLFEEINNALEKHQNNDAL